MTLAPALSRKRAAGAAACERREPNLIDSFLDFQNFIGLTILFPENDSSNMTASIASPVLTRAPAPAISQARELHIIIMVLIRKRRPRKKNGWGVGATL